MLPLVFMLVAVLSNNQVITVEGFGNNYTCNASREWLLKKGYYQDNEGNAYTVKEVVCEREYINAV